MSREQEPFITVLTPVYNGENFLAECIESVLSQTYSNFEYIIVNNCSTDRTLEIASSYATRDSRIRIYSNDCLVDVIKNHNIAFSMTAKNATYCKIVSADDYLAPECLTRLVECGEANPSVGIIGAYQLSGRYIRWQGFPYPTAVFSGPDLCRRILCDDQYFLGNQAVIGFGTPTSLLYRGDLVRNNNPNFYPNSSPHADTSACFKYLAECDFGFVYQVLSYERTHTATQSHRSAQINRYLSATLDDLIQYGAFYLDKNALDQSVRKKIQDYHRFLAISYVTGPKEKDFWDYHRDRLKELGYPLRRMDLFWAAIRTATKEMMNPELAIRKASARLRRP